MARGVALRKHLPIGEQMAQLFIELIRQLWNSTCSTSEWKSPCGLKTQSVEGKLQERRDLGSERGVYTRNINMLINCTSWTKSNTDTNSEAHQQQHVTVTTHNNASSHGASTHTYGHYGVHMTNVPYTTHPTGLLRQNSLCSPQPCTPEQAVFPPHCPHNGVIVYPSLINRDFSVEAPPEYEKDCSKAPWRFAYRKVCVLSIALFSILLVGMFVEFWYFSRLHPIDSQLNCVQCSRLKLSADPLDDYSSGLNIFTKQGILYCCARNHSQQQQIFDAVSTIISFLFNFYIIYCIVMETGPTERS